MGGEVLGVVGAGVLEQPGGALDVGEEERDDARGSCGIGRGLRPEGELLARHRLIRVNVCAAVGHDREHN